MRALARLGSRGAPAARANPRTLQEGAAGSDGVNGADLLSVRGLAVHYAATAALQPLDLSLREGDFVLVLGPNGAGKTSLVRAIAGAVAASAGTVRLAGENLTGLPAFRRVRHGIALVPEGRGTLPGLSVEENLVLGWQAADPAVRGDKSAAFDVAMELFPVLRQRRKQDCATLSGGEMQMLAIARAILARPRILLLDEPSLGLAPQIVERACEVLVDLNEGGLTMIMVEQKSVPLRRSPTETLVLRGGQIVHRQAGGRPADKELARLYLPDGAA